LNMIDVALPLNTSFYGGHFTTLNGVQDH